MSRRPLGLIIWLCAGPILQSRLLKLSNSTHNCPAWYSPNTAEVLPSSYDYPLILKQMHPVYTVLPLNLFPFGRTIKTFFLITLVVRSPPSVCKGRGQSIINQQCRQDVSKMGNFTLLDEYDRSYHESTTGQKTTSCQHFTIIVLT